MALTFSKQMGVGGSIPFVTADPPVARVSASYYFTQRSKRLELQGGAETGPLVAVSANISLARNSAIVFADFRSHLSAILGIKFVTRSTGTVQTSAKAYVLPVPPSGESV